MDKPKNKGGRPRKIPLLIQTEHDEETENTESDVTEPETPPVFTPMDTDAPPVQVKPRPYEGKVNAIISGDTAILHLDGETQIIKTDVFNKIFKPAAEKAAAPAPAEKGNWSFQFHTPTAVPAQFRKPNGTFDIPAMNAWMDASPDNVKQGIPGCMIGRIGT